MRLWKSTGSIIKDGLRQGLTEGSEQDTTRMQGGNQIEDGATGKIDIEK